MEKALRLLIVIATFFATLAHQHSVLAADAPLSFGAVPYQSPSKMAQHWLPVLKYIADKSGVPLQFMTAKDMTTFESRLRQGDFDITFMNPFLYIELHKTVGYEPLVKGKLKTEGIIIVKVDSPFKSLQDLQDLELAFPSAAAFGPSMLPRAFMQKQGVTTVAHYVGSHESVYQTVASGIYPAGGGAKHTFEALQEDMRRQLRILWASNPFTPPPIAAHPRVATELRTKLTQALVHMHEDTNGLQLLKQIGFAPGFDSAVDSDWNDIRSLDLGSLKTLTE